MSERAKRRESIAPRMSKHYDGPWHWRTTTIPGSRNENGRYHECRLGNDRGARVGVVDVIEHPNACLIVKAPEMYELLRRIAETYMTSVHDLPPMVLEAIDLITDIDQGPILAKAEGGAE